MNRIKVQRCATEAFAWMMCCKCKLIPVEPKACAHCNIIVCDVCVSGFECMKCKGALASATFMYENLRIHCKYIEKGCSQTLSLKLLELHELICEYKPKEIKKTKESALNIEEIRAEARKIFNQMEQRMEPIEEEIKNIPPLKGEILRLNENLNNAVSRIEKLENNQISRNLEERPNMQEKQDQVAKVEISEMKEEIKKSESQTELIKPKVEEKNQRDIFTEYFSPKKGTQEGGAKIEENGWNNIFSPEANICPRECERSDREMQPLHEWRTPKEEEKIQKQSNAEIVPPKKKVEDSKQADVEMVSQKNNKFPYKNHPRETYKVKNSNIPILQ